MINQGEAVAIITARGGSKNLPRKNILPLGGKPLIAHTIIAAKNAACVDGVYVTTDDTEIATISQRFGSDVMNRPAELATDAARSEDVLRHALETLIAAGQKFEYVILLQPTSPLRATVHIDECWRLWRASGALSAVSVTEVQHHPYKDYIIKDGLLKPLITADVLHQPRQEYPRVVRQTGAIYMMYVRNFLEHKTFFIEPVMPYFMSAKESVDIDTRYDLELAERYCHEYRIGGRAG